MTWEDDLDEAQRRLAELDGAHESAAAATWRSATVGSSFFLPIPLVAQDEPSLEGEWCAEGDAPMFDRVGLDALGRPVAHLLVIGGLDGFPQHLWEWDDDGSFLEIQLSGHFGPYVRRVRVVDGRIEHVATASAEGRTSVRLLRWSGEQAVRADHAERWDGGGIDSATVVDPAIGLRRHEEEATDELHAGLERAAAFVPEPVIWDRRVLQPEVWPDDPAALVEPLASALDRALRAAVRDTGIADPFVLEIRPQGRGPSFPPFARVAGAEWRDGMRRSSREDGAAIEQLYQGVGLGGAAHLELADHLDDEALRACRILSTALLGGAPWKVSRAAAAVADAVGDELARLLNSTPPAGAADPFLALVHVGDPYGEKDPIERARATVGDAHVERFLRSVASTAPPPADAETLRRALTDRAALEALMRELGLAAHAQRLAHDVAAEALLLEPGETDGSRLGGPALLPPNTSWPTHAGQDLTFLAAIDLAAAPRPGVAALLPVSGWLLFFADIDRDHDAELTDAVNQPDAAIRVFATDEVVAAELRGAPLRPRPIVLRPILTLPSGHEAPLDLGLNAFEASVYRELCDELAAALTDARSTHWIGGHATGIQGFTPEPGTFLLLHLEWDDDLDFQFLDGGDLQFRIPTDALAVRDWSRITTTADSS